jgi:hypothetical protein
MTQEMYEKAVGFLDYIELREVDNESRWMVSDSAPEELKNLVSEVKGHSFHDEWTMQFIYDSLSALAENGSQGIAPYIEPDFYANQLTNWLNSDDSRLKFMTQALQNEVIRDGFEAL